LLASMKGIKIVKQNYQKERDIKEKVFQIV